jgi:hypothetical protein
MLGSILRHTAIDAPRAALGDAPWPTLLLSTSKARVRLMILESTSFRPRRCLCSRTGRGDRRRRDLSRHRNGSAQLF